MSRRAGGSTSTAVASGSTTTTQGTHSSSHLNLVARQSLLKQLTTSSCSYSAPTALFFAERLHALDNSHEPAAFLLASLLAHQGSHLDAIHILRQPISFLPQQPTPPDPNDNPFQAPPRRWTQSTRTVRPAIEASLRCARLYSQSCLALGRHQEGRDLLAKLLLPNTPLAPQDPIDLPLAFPANSDSASQPHVLHLELARLARNAGEHARAIQSYRKVLDANPWCWEALEGLCSEGAPPDADSLYPPRPRPPHSAPISPLPNHSRPLQPTSTHPPPLGPSQTSAVNSAFSFSKARGPHNGNGAPAEGLGFFTPSDTASPVLGAGLVKGKGGGLFGLGAGAQALGSVWKGGRRGADVSEMSVDDRYVHFAVLPRRGEADPVPRRRCVARVCCFSAPPPLTPPSTHNPSSISELVSTTSPPTLTRPAQAHSSPLPSPLPSLPEPLPV